MNSENEAGSGEDSEDEVGNPHVVRINILQSQWLFATNIPFQPHKDITVFLRKSTLSLCKENAASVVLLCFQIVT